ncbi:deoxyribodipyrimidine photolyase [Bellilinea caldifistulae]|nr:deoxyribodipyrimidine photo-lyase [Bellilinea caldifistulae]GAP11704.1 deoxyribodipyrimidine photolyase [Bellilinea caldifistulae]
MPTHIWWIRRDLRLKDNPALHSALQGGHSVLPLFILDPRLLNTAAENRRHFLFNGLRRLDEDLRSRGSRLIVRSGLPEEVLPAVVAETGADGVFAEEDYTPYAVRRDANLARYIPLQRVVGVTVHHPAAVVKPDGSPYTVFTPFSKAWKALPLPKPLPPIPDHLPPPPFLPSDPIPPAPENAYFPAGEAEAERRLLEFLDSAVFAYADDRNRLDVDGTSRLSPYLRFGMISARRAAALTMEKIQQTADPAGRKGAETFLNELIWREFYNAILYHFPHVLQTAFNPALRNIEWRHAPAELAAWQQGLTGIPVVDACMRQLLTMGWMHNRGRMIVASFLVKDLLINWQEGERWFMRHLVDGDPAANNGGWQWTAGVGTDAAPYFRIFNPILQSKKFDPYGHFIRRWLPELERLPDEYLHEPWLTPAEIQRKTGFKPGRDYPLPLVDHAQVKERTLRAYQQSKPREGT